LQTAAATERWSLIGVVVAGLFVMVVVRLALRSSFFQTPRERASK
jgi:hypothetical protein